MTTVPWGATLIRAAHNYLKQHETSRIRRIYFLAWTTRHRKACQDVLDQLTDLTPVSADREPSPAGG